MTAPTPYLKVWIRHLVVSGEVLLANFLREINWTTSSFFLRVYVAVECDVTFFSGQKNNVLAVISNLLDSFGGQLK